MSTNNLDLQKFNDLKNRVQFEYRKIGKIFSPALKSDIWFTSNGFHHLRYDSTRSERSKKIQKNKFIYFIDALNILKKATTIQEYRRSIITIEKHDKSDFSKIKIVEWFAFFSIVSFTKKIRIKVIVRRVGGELGQYHFWSVIPYWTLSNKNRIVSSKEIEDN